MKKLSGWPVLTRLLIRLSVPVVNRLMRISALLTAHWRNYRTSLYRVSHPRRSLTLAIIAYLSTRLVGSGEAVALWLAPTAQRGIRLANAACSRTMGSGWLTICCLSPTVFRNGRDRATAIAAYRTIGIRAFVRCTRSRLVRMLSDREDYCRHWVAPTRCATPTDVQRRLSRGTSALCPSRRGGAADNAQPQYIRGVYPRQAILALSLLLFAAPAFAQAPVILLRPAPNTQGTPGPDGTIHLVSAAGPTVGRVDFYAGDCTMNGATSNRCGFIGTGLAFQTPTLIPPAVAILLPAGAEQVSFNWKPNLAKPTTMALWAFACQYVTICNRKGDIIAGSFVSNVTIMPTPPLPAIP